MTLLEVNEQLSRLIKRVTALEQIMPTEPMQAFADQFWVTEQVDKGRTLVIEKDKDRYNVELRDAGGLIIAAYGETVARAFAQLQEAEKMELSFDKLHRMADAFENAVHGKPWARSATVEGLRAALAVR